MLAYQNSESEQLTSEYSFRYAFIYQKNVMHTTIDESWEISSWILPSSCLQCVAPPIHIKINKIPWEKSAHSQLLVIACFCEWIDFGSSKRRMEWEWTENLYRLSAIKKISSRKWFMPLKNFYFYLGLSRLYF